MTYLSLLLASPESRCRTCLKRNCPCSLVAVRPSKSVPSSSPTGGRSRGTAKRRRLESSAPHPAPSTCRRSRPCRRDSRRSLVPLTHLAPRTVAMRVWRSLSLLPVHILLLRQRPKDGELDFRRLSLADFDPMEVVQLWRGRISPPCTVRPCRSMAGDKYRRIFESWEEIDNAGPEGAAFGTNRLVLQMSCRRRRRDRAVRGRGR